MPKTPDVADQQVAFTPDLFIVPGVVMLDRELQPLDSKVYAIIYWMEHLKDGRCYASNGAIAKVAGSSSSGVASSLVRLRDRNYILCQYDDKNQRTGIVTLVQMRKGGYSNEQGGVAEMSNKDSNTKEKYTSEQLTNIKKVYIAWLKFMVVDPAVRFHGSDDDRSVALQAALTRTKLTELRKTKVNARLNSLGLAQVLKAINTLSESDFHRGDNDRNWTASLEWLCGSDEKIEEWANKYKGGNHGE